MSTDDIEIVAVSSKEQMAPPTTTNNDASSTTVPSSTTRGNKNNKHKSASFASGTYTKKKNNNNKNDDAEQPAYEIGCKPVKGRSGTPGRRHSCDDIDLNEEANASKSASQATKSSHHNRPSPTDISSIENNPTSPRRLVKGVQIYLRERSTGT